MSSVLRSVRKRKKGRTLGSVDIIDREEYAELEIDAKVELIRSLVPLGLMPCCAKKRSSRLLKNSAKWDRQIDPVVLRCSPHCREPDHARTR